MLCCSLRREQETWPLRAAVTGTGKKTRGEVKKAEEAEETLLTY